MELKDYMNSINQTKENLIRKSDSQDQAKKQYPAFVVARSFSYHQNLIPIVELLNQYNIPNHEHYEFLLNVVPKGKRFAKWSKPDNNATIKALVERFGYSYDKAKSIAHILSEAQLEAVLKEPEYGGVMK